MYIIYTCTCQQTHKWVCVYTYAKPLTHVAETHMQTYIRTCMYAWTLVHAYTCERKHIQNTDVCKDMCAHSHMQRHTHLYTCTYTWSQMYSYRHTRTYIHICTNIPEHACEVDIRTSSYKHLYKQRYKCSNMMYIQA